MKTLKDYTFGIICEQEGSYRGWVWDTDLDEVIDCIWNREGQNLMPMSEEYNFNLEEIIELPDLPKRKLKVYYRAATYHWNGDDTYEHGTSWYPSKEEALANLGPDVVVDEWEARKKPDLLDV